MKNTHRIALAGALLVAGTAFATASIVRSQEGDEAAMMAQMMKLATPGPRHEALAADLGDWTQTYQMKMGPDAPWQESTGTSTTRALLGGRYILQETEMSFMGMTLNGMHMIGYDNRAEEYISLWADSMSTWWVTSRGKAREDGVIETKGTMIDFAGERPFRMTIEHRDDGTVYSEMFDTIPPKGEMKVMTITSTKKG